MNPDVGDYNGSAAVTVSGECGRYFYACTDVMLAVSQKLLLCKYLEFAP